MLPPRLHWFWSSLAHIHSWLGIHTWSSFASNSWHQATSAAGLFTVQKYWLRDLSFILYIFGLGIFFLTGIFTPASWLLNLWGCPCFKTSCFTVLCDFTEYLHALPPNGCKAESHEPICTCRLMSCAALCSSLGFGLLYSGIEEKTLTEG